MERTPIKIVASLHPEGDGYLQLSPSQGKTPVEYIDAANKGAALKPEDVPHGSGSTGRCDDIDDVYSGKSGPNPEDWKSKGAVRKTYHGGVRPEHMLFDSISHEKALAQKPFITCPNCGQKVKELDGGTEAYPQPVKEGQYVTGENQPVKDLPPVFHYQLHPCGCRVNQEWATAFTVELNRRKAGEEPHQVIDMTEAQRETRQKSLQEQIGKLYTQKAALERLVREHALVTDQTDLFEVECRLVALTDQLMRLIPGKHNFKEDVSVSQRVQKWAKENRMTWDGKSKLEQNAEKSAYGPDYPMPKLGYNKSSTDATTPVGDLLDQGMATLLSDLGIPPDAFKGTSGLSPAVQTKPVGQPPSSDKSQSQDQGCSYTFGAGDIAVRRDWVANAFLVTVRDRIYRRFSTRADAEDAAHVLYQDVLTKPMEAVVGATGAVDMVRERVPVNTLLWESRIPKGSSSDDVIILPYPVSGGAYPLTVYVVRVKNVTIGQFHDQQAAMKYAQSLRDKLDKSSDAGGFTKKAWGEATGIFANFHDAEADNLVFSKKDLERATVRPLPFNFKGGPEDQRKEAYRLAGLLHKAEQSVREATELAIKDHTGPTAYNLVKAALVQIQSGLMSVDGKPVMGDAAVHSVQEAAKLLHSHTSTRKLAEMAMQVLQHRRVFCVQLITQQVCPGCTVAQAREALDSIWHRLRGFVQEAQPLSSNATAFLSAFGDYLNNGGNPSKPTVQTAPVAAPLAKPQVPSGTARPRRVVRVFTPRKG